MAVNKTIELYRILKKAQPEGDFSAYEKRIAEYQQTSLNRYISSLCAGRAPGKTDFLKITESDVNLREREIEDYKLALENLVKRCKDCIKNGIDISNLRTEKLFSGGRLNLSSTSAVNTAVSALNSADNGAGGVYFTEEPLEILFNPVTESNRGEYEREFMRTIADYTSAGKIEDKDVSDFLKRKGCSFASRSFIKTVASGANSKLTGEIRRETNRNILGLSLSIYLPLLILFAVLGAPALVLAAIGTRINVSGYVWIAVAALGVICGFVPMLFSHIFFGRPAAYRQYGARPVKMFGAPFVITCVCLAGLLGSCTYLLWRGGVEIFPATIAFGAVYLIYYVISVSVHKRNYSGDDINGYNTMGLSYMFFGLFKSIFPYCVSVLFCGSLGSYLTFNLLALASNVIYEIADAEYVHPVGAAFLSLGLSASASLLITSLLALCRVEGLYIFYLVAFNYNVAAMYSLSIIFMIIVFVVGISLAIKFFYDDNAGCIAFALILLAISAVVYGVGFAKFDKIKKSKNSSIVGNCVLIIEDGTLKHVYGSTEKLEIPGRVTKISSKVFDNEFSAKEIVVLSTVKSIESEAFINCKKLNSITLPFAGSDADGKISQYFGYIFGKEKFKGGIEADFDGATYYFPAGLTSVTILGGTVKEKAFTNCSFLTEINLQSGVTGLGENVFGDCASLKSLTLPFVGASGKETSASRVTLFGNLFSKTDRNKYWKITQAYSGSSSENTYYVPGALKNVTVLGGKIYRGAFSNFKMIESVTLEKNVQGIEDSAFSGCTALENLTVPFVGAGLNDTGYDRKFFGYIFGSTKFDGGERTEQTYFGEYGSESTYTFYIPSSLKNVTVLDGYISSGVFSNCSKLESIVLPSALKSVGRNAFKGCTKLIKTVGGVQYVNDWAVGYKDGTKTLKIADGTVGIADGAFEKSAIESLEMPKSVIYIGTNAFRDATVKNVNYLGTVEEWSKISFANEDSSPVKNNLSLNGELLTSLTLPKRMEKIPKYAFNNIKSLKSLTIPERVTEIAAGALSGLTYLTEINYNSTALTGLKRTSGIFAYAGRDGTGITVNIGASVTVIPGYLFYTADREASPNIVKLKFAENSVCTTIEDYAFANCASLKEVTLPQSVTTIYPHAFDDCTELIECENGIYYAGNWAIGYAEGITEAAIRKGTEGIAEEAFKDCITLESLVLPSSVKKMGKDVFTGCTALEEVSMPFTVESFGIENFRTCENLKKLITASGTFVRFVMYYDKDGEICSHKLLKENEVLSRSELFSPPQAEGYLFGGWYSHKSLDMSYITTKVTAEDAGFIYLYPYYFNARETQTLSSGDASYSKVDKNVSTNPSVSFDLSRLNALRQYGYLFGFSLSYSAQGYNSITLKAPSIHSSAYKASFSSSYELSYNSNSVYKSGPSVSATISASWTSGTRTESASSYASGSFGSYTITENSVKLTATYSYSTDLGMYGSASFTIPAVTVTVYYSLVN